MILFLLVGWLFSFDVSPDSYHEVDFGRNYPTALYDKYADDGFSYRYSFSRAFERKNTLREGLFKWQIGVQYISFRSNYWYDYFELEGVSQGPSIQITNSEQGYVVNGGFRVTASNGLNTKGNFRPYVGALFGMSFFNEKTTYDWGDDCSAFDIFLDIIFDNTDFCDNNNSSTDVNDRSWSPTFTLDIGTNIFFNKSQDVGMDIGIRYNMLTELKRPDTIYEVSGAIDKIANYL